VTSQKSEDLLLSYSWSEQFKKNSCPEDERNTRLPNVGNSLLVDRA